VPQSANQLQVAYAEKELAQLRHLRAVVEASAHGTSQTAIALDAGISQAEVSRILRRVSLVPSMIENSPREIILRWVVGEETHASMMRKLETWDYSFARDVEPDNPLGSRSSGSWDQVTDALHRGFLSDSDYENLLQRARASTSA
jgi:hypothetical protein